MQNGEFDFRIEKRAGKDYSVCLELICKGAELWFSVYPGTALQGAEIRFSIWQDPAI